MKDDALPARKGHLLALFVLGGALLAWGAVSALRLYPESSLPGPAAVCRGFWEEARSGRLLNDLIASLFRVGTGFALATAVGIPFGLWMGSRAAVRAAWLPAVNFFRSLSPIAWIPFAILWFGIGDPPVIFLIFMSTFFTLTLAVTAAVAGVPGVYFRVAQENGIRGRELLLRVKLPAVMPPVITALRVTAGVAWVVVVAAEMIAGRDGLGFAIMDARNGLRPDLVVVGMITIGVIGVVLDRLLVRLADLPSVRWGHER